MPSPEADTRREEGRHLERFCRDGAPFFHGSLSLLCKDVSVQAPLMELLGWGGVGGQILSARVFRASPSLPPGTAAPCGSGGSAGEVFTADTVAAISLGAGLSRWQPLLLPLPPAEPSPRACPSRDFRGQRQDALLQPRVPSALLLLSLLLPVGGSPRDLPSLDGAL